MARVTAKAAPGAAHSASDTSTNMHIDLGCKHLQKTAEHTSTNSDILPPVCLPNVRFGVFVVVAAEKKKIKTHHNTKYCYGKNEKIFKQKLETFQNRRKKIKNYNWIL